MVKIIGIVLLLFGVIGFMVIIILGVWLNWPNGSLKKLKDLLQAHIDRLEKGMGMARTAIELVNNAMPYLESMYNGVECVTGAISQQVDSAGDTIIDLLDSAASSLDDAKGVLQVISIPTLEPYTKTLGPVSFNFKVVNDITVKPPGVKLGDVGFTIPSTEIPGLRLKDPPQFLTPVADALGNVGEKLGSAKNILVRMHNDLNTVLSSLGHVLKLMRTFGTEAPNMLFSISTNILTIIKFAGHYKLIPIVSLVVLGSFGLFHLAIALIGLALLLV